VEEAGYTVFARIDHGEEAMNAGINIRPTQLLVFGKPKLDSPLMQGEQRAGIDLPLKVLSWQNENGHVQVGYRNQTVLYFFFNHGAHKQNIDRIRYDLDRFTRAASGAKSMSKSPGVYENFAGC
jgi:uncharacterized protein (DUF302 family)